MAKIKNLLDKSNEIIYPVTIASGVFMPNGVDTVERILNDFRGQGTKVVFGDNGDITITYTASGNVEKIQFLGNYIVSKTYAGEVMIAYQRTKFNADGSIETTIEEESEEEE